MNSEGCQGRGCSTLSQQVNNAGLRPCCAHLMVESVGKERSLANCLGCHARSGLLLRLLLLCPLLPLPIVRCCWLWRSRRRRCRLAGRGAQQLEPRAAV